MKPAAQPKFKYPASVATDANRLRVLWRLQQRLIEQHNAAMPSDPGKARAFRNDWHTRLLELHRQINRLKPVVHPDLMGHCEEGSAEATMFHDAKMTGRADGRYDAELAGHPILAVPDLGDLPPAPDPREKFETYTELDPGDHVAIDGTGYIATVTGLPNSDIGGVDTLLSKDKGADHFAGNFTHLFELTLDAYSANLAAAAAYQTAIEVEDNQDNADTAGVTLLVSVWPRRQIWIVHREAGVSVDSDFWDFGALATPYYISYERSGENVTCLIYTGSHGGTLKDTLTMLDTDAVARRYVFAMQNRDQGGVLTFDFTVANLDLQEVSPAYYFRENVLERRRR